VVRWHARTDHSRRQAGPNVPALGHSIVEAPGADVSHGALLTNLLDGDPVLIDRGEIGQPQQPRHHISGIDAPKQQKAPRKRPELASDRKAA